MSFFNKNTDDVIDALKEAINSFDVTVSNVNDLLTFNPKEGIWVELWSTSEKISMTISIVAVCMAVIYAYTAIVKEGLTLKGDFKKIITILLRLCIAKGMIDYSVNFMYWIYSFGSKITRLTNGATEALENQSLIKLLDDPAKNDYLAGLGLENSPSALECFVGYIQTKFLFGIFFWGLGIFLMIIALARILKIYTLAMISSIAFAKLPYYGFEGIKEYIRSILALSMQGAIMIGAIALYKTCIVEASNIAGFYTGSIFGTFGTMVIISVSLVLIIAKSETIAKIVV